MEKKNNFKRFNVPEVRIYLFVLLIFAIILLLIELWIGIGALIIDIALVVFNFIKSRQRRKDWTKYLEDLSEDIDWATRYAVLNVPMPMAVVEQDGQVMWYNPGLSQLLGNSLLDKNISDCIEGFQFKQILHKEDGQRSIVTMKSRQFEIFDTPVKINSNTRDEKTILLLYFQDITELLSLKDQIARTRLVIMYVQIDNYDEIISQTDQEKLPLIMATVDRMLHDWVAGVGGSMQKYDSEKYYVVMEVQSLSIIEERKFKLLDEIRKIEIGNPIPITLSIGVGCKGSSPEEVERYAKDAIDLALGRGGDQAVVKTKEQLRFYGGKTKEVEKRAKVKSRVIANALHKLMEESTDIYIMGHQMPDLDCIGAALGIYRCAVHIKKPAYIIVNDMYPLVHDIIRRTKNNEYRDVFIAPEAARARIKPDSLIVVVDTHRPSYTEASWLLKEGLRTVVIDHHRRDAEQIEDAVLSYLEPYASSTSELVAEIVQYFDDKVTFNTVEAEALLAGIIMDTKGFTFKTGVRTFEAASYLRRGGADPVKVKDFFAEDLESFKNRADTVAGAKLIAAGVVLSICRSTDASTAPIIAAQAADALINIKQIHTSFVLCRVGTQIMVSARSQGTVNVQVILEKLGGGGHMSIAGAQLQTEDMDDAVDTVKKAFEEYKSEEGKS